MTIRTETRRVSITLRVYRGGWNAGYEPDIFDDAEACFIIGRPRDAGSNDVLATDKDTDELIEWWRAEVASVNRGEDRNSLFGLTQEQIDDGDEWILGVDETPLDD